MRRVHLVSVLLAVALLVPSALLIQRALAGVTAEREARERAVAERVFDEMERALSELLASEEARAPASWPSATPGEAEPFVLGWFEIGADGRVAVPRPTTAAGADEPALRRTVEALAARLLAEPAAPLGRRAAAAAAPHQAGAGHSQALAADDLGEAALEDAAPRETETDEAAATPADAYSALRSLNRGVAQRALRQRKRVPADLEGFSAKAEPQLDALVAEEAPAAAPPARPAWLVDPLQGRVLGAHLILVRTVWSPAGAIRQGVVLEAEGLARWLGRRGLAPGLGSVAFRLAGAAVGDGDRAEPQASDAAATRHAHRFAEPFHALEVAVALPAFPGSGGEASVLGLALLLIGAVALGLLALHRTVAVSVSYAERRSRFAAAVAHELRTPLTAIRMIGEMLRDGLVPEPDRRHAYLETLTDESERLSRLVDDVLDFSHLERGGRPLALVSGDLGAVVRDAASRLGPHVERAGFRLELEIEPALPAVRFDRDALLHILTNLVDNAIKYANEARDRRIRVCCTRRDGSVQLRVGDHGPGVTPRELARIFEPFQRGEDELTRTRQGAGIGLALVRGLAERMGAAVRGRNLREGGFEVSLVFAAGR